MKVLAVLLALVAVSAAASSSDYLELLTAFDFEGLLNNEEQRKIAFNCLLEAKNCGDFQPVRDGVVKVIQNKCGECTPEQKQKYENVMRTFREKFEPVYNEFMKKIGTSK